MKLKKFEARTEQEAIEKVREELGASALILNIKKTLPKGLFAFFRKPVVEVTAAFDEKNVKTEITGRAAAQAAPANYFVNRMFDEKPADISVVPAPQTPEAPQADDGATSDSKALLDSLAMYQQKEKIKDLEQRLETAEDMLSRAVSQLSIAAHRQLDRARKYENNMIQVFYDALLEQGVTEEIAEEVLQDIAAVEGGVDLTTVVKVVYNKLVKILGEPKDVDLRKAPKGQPQVMVFIGPTGVGKTTTIAKLSSLFILGQGLNVGFVTADTYRIAAVEQLKIYAEILGVETAVVYNNDDLTDSLKTLSGINDIIMVDTAGRSHKNKENLEELKALLSAVPESEKFLVLSTTTKHEDLLEVVRAYSEFTDFCIIFTKLDETACFGTILNVCHATGRKVAYVTNGQNVPDDIEKIHPEKIAKALMGLEGATS